MTAAERRHPTTYGWRAKIGLIVPPTNTVNEAEWQIMAPDGVTIHSTRMPLHADTTSEAGKAALYADIEKAVADLAQAGPDCIAYGCTAGSMVMPITALTDLEDNKRRHGTIAGERAQRAGRQKNLHRHTLRRYPERS